MHHHPQNQERALNLSILIVSGPGESCLGPASPLRNATPATTCGYNPDSLQNGCGTMSPVNPSCRTFRVTGESLRESRRIRDRSRAKNRRPNNTGNTDSSPGSPAHSNQARNPGHGDESAAAYRPDDHNRPD